ncbi:hypothetical protein [Reinekea blandensis]|uniref:Uncharacterized protein n=1 Tax=Reinekea blandensis MED297 TaxID=314283 RepID=A4BJF6_9GAMM|nr:hypothetical protein [Reinekea blandensis]EAR07728.1 hypothetical protein MED297_01975 [Reinekea sp. MED297] [Reinekea blandensis MED297]
MDHTVLTDYVNAMFSGQPEPLLEPLKSAAVPAHQAMTPCFITPKNQSERALALWTMLSLANAVPHGRLKQRLLTEARRHLEIFNSDRRS